MDKEFTAQDLRLFRQRAAVCRAEAELTSRPEHRQERLETALAYERMIERAKRLFGLEDA